MKHNSDFKYDLSIGVQKEKQLALILGDNCTIEVKYDRYKNDRFFIEYKYDDGQKSYNTGLSTTQADYYALAKSTYFFLIKTSVLKDKVRLFAKNNKPVRGGDNNTAIGFLVPISFLVSL